MDDGPALRRRTASGWPSCPTAWMRPTPPLRFSPPANNHENGHQGRKTRSVSRRSSPFSPKIGGLFRRPAEQPTKKAFHRAPMSGETLFFMRCLRNLTCGGFALHSNRRAVQPSTHCATACATPSSSLESVTRSATTFTSSAALAIATPMPAKRNMARSLKPSPNAMSCSRDKPR